MRSLFGSTASLLLTTLVTGCTWVDADECWVNTSGGFGGGGTIPIGAGVGATSSGDFNTPPPGDPLDYSDAPNPCIVTESPCIEKCQTDYETASIPCGKIEDEAPRRACQDEAYVRYKSCRENCTQQSDEKCRQACDKAYDRCMDRCKDGKCRDACFKDYVACLKDCGR